MQRDQRGKKYHGEKRDTSPFFSENFDADVRTRIVSILEALVPYLGPPTSRNAREWRFGSIAVVVKGAKAGLWIRHSSPDERGFVFSLIERAVGLPSGGRNRAAREWAASVIGWSAWSPSRSTGTKAPPPVDHGDDKCRAAAAEKAQRIWRHARPAVEHAYLQKKALEPHGLRIAGIDAGAAHRGALVVPLADVDGKITTVEFIRSDGQKRYMVNGLKRGSFCVIGRDPTPLDDVGDTVLIAEGWATAVSVYMAVGGTVIAAMDAGNLEPVAEAIRARHPDVEIVLCADNDIKTSKAENRGINAARKAAAAVGGRVAIPVLPDGGKADFDDLRQALGLDAVRAAIAAAETTERAVEAEPAVVHEGRPGRRKIIEPFYPVVQGDRDAAIAKHGDVVRAWARAAIRDARAAKEVAARADGLKGADRAKVRKQIKTEFGLDYLPRSTVAAERLQGVMLSGAQGAGKTASLVGREGQPGALHGAIGLVSLMLVPDHNKALEVLHDYADNAPDDAPPAILVRGRGAVDPDRPDQKMCRLSRQANILAARGLSVRKALCERCPFSADCSYLEQETRIVASAAGSRGVVLFGPHDLAWSPLPGRVDVDLIVFDERPRDFGVSETFLPIADLLAPSLRYAARAWTPGRHAAVEREADALAGLQVDIAPAAAAVAGAFDDEPQALARLRDAGIDRPSLLKAITALSSFIDRSTVKACRSAIERSSGADLEGGLDDAIATASRSSAIPMRALFAAIAREIDQPRASCTAVTLAVDANGTAGLRAVSLKALAHSKAALLHLDGTGDHELAARLFGPMTIEHHRVDRTPPGRADEVIQVVDRKFAKRGLLEGNYTGSWAQYYERQRTEISKLIAAHVGCVVACNKAVADVLRPEAHGASRATFGALRGRNTWQAADTIIVVGTDQPSPQAIETIARAYAAADPAPFVSLGADRYPKTERGIRMRDGSGICIDVDAHPHAVADAILRQIRDCEIEQAVDRLRPIFRTRPIKVIVMAPVALDLTVTKVATLQELASGGSRIERALADYRVVPMSPREASRHMASIWPHHSSASRDLTEAGLLAQNVNRFSYLHFAPIAGAACVVAYAVEPEPGGRARTHRALVAANLVDAERVLAKVVGTLRAFEIVEVIGGTDEHLVAAQPVTPPADPTPAEIKAAAAARLGARVREFIQAATAPARQVSRTASVVDSLIEQAVEQARAVGGSASARNLLARLAGAHIERRDNLASFREAVAAAAVAPPDP